MKTSSNDPRKKRIDRAVQRADIYRCLDDLGIKYRTRPGNDLWFKCPAYGHKESEASAHITADPFSKYYGVWYCFGCHTGGTIVSLAKTVWNLKLQEAINFVEARHLDHAVNPFDNDRPETEIRLPLEYESYSKKKQWNPAYIDYLEKRKITFKQVVHHHIGYCESGEYAGRVIVPVLLLGILRTWVGRAVGDTLKRITSAKGGKPGLFGSEMSDPSLGPAILCEGWADALHVERLGYANAMALQTNRIHQVQFDFLRRFPYLIVIPDGDRGGVMLEESLAPYVEEKEILVAHLPAGLDPANADDPTLDEALQNVARWKPIVPYEKIEIEL